MLLELLIALFLVGTLIFPLVQMPLHMMREQARSYYHSQLGRLADEALAQLKEKLYTNEITWGVIDGASDRSIDVFEDTCALEFPSLDVGIPEKKLFLERKVSMKCGSKKTKGAESWWLMEVRVELLPPKGKEYMVFKKKLKPKHPCYPSCKVFSYRLILHKRQQ